MQIVSYHKHLKNQVIGFIQKIWFEFNKSWEPEGRDKDFFNISSTYQLSGGEFWVVLDEKGDVVGTVALKPLSPNEVELKRFYLDSIYRGQGIGKKLITKSIEKAKERGFKNIKLDTSKKLTQAYSLFQKFGFKEVEPYLDNARSDTFMELSL